MKLELEDGDAEIIIGALLALVRRERDSHANGAVSAATATAMNAANHHSGSLNGWAMCTCGHLRQEHENPDGVVGNCWADISGTGGSESCLCDSFNEAPRDT